MRGGFEHGQYLRAGGGDEEGCVGEPGDDEAFEEDFVVVADFAGLAGYFFDYVVVDEEDLEELVG